MEELEDKNEKIWAGKRNRKMLGTIRPNKGIKHDEG